MIYLTPEIGNAIGRMLKELGEPAEVILTSESLIIKVGTRIADCKTETAKSAKPAKRRYNKPIEWAGQSMIAREWAKKLGVTPHTISYRMKKYGNPGGAPEKPTDADAVVMGAAEV